MVNSSTILSSPDGLNSTLHDHTHKGTGQAGNKSLLSYRHDIGIPGYTGFISNAHSVAVPIKGNTKYIGKRADNETFEKTISGLVNSDTKSIYSKEFAKPPAGDGKKEVAGGYWIANANNRDDRNSKQFIAQSTYKAEIQESAKSAETALSQTIIPGLRFTRKSVTSDKDVFEEADSGYSSQLAYQTEYSSMRLRNPLTGKTRTRVGMSAGEGKASGGDDSAAKESFGITASKFDGKSIYSQGYGKYGSNPLDQVAKSQKDMSKASSFREFQLGTTKGTSKIPGYSGFIPSTDNNTKAMSQAMGSETRPNAKNEMLLFSLDQYSRDSIPHYRGFRPQDGGNIKPHKPPSKETTQGRTNFEAAQAVANGCNFNDGPRDNFRSSDKGIMSFFSQGSTYVSENGTAYAERYYHTLRPKEGLPRVYYPSKTTLSGYKFAQ
ncbi:flagellar associated protein [Chloropicon roscoffensis]|uniref:Flagellar associated protein n=1 Tax=Chloropicon roscoffensis TaxID=1461544 RepID=A0AAX4P5W5_9CHLO